jgi:ubiquinone/menaquinone biosynthesis C-methylase UbiE
MSTASGLATEGTPTPESKRRGRPAMWLVRKLGDVAPDKKDALQRALIRKGYQAVNKRLDKINQNCMNYGWATLEGDGLNLKLEDVTVLDQFGLQLYNQVASAVDLTDKDVLEVGCGRGAGTKFISTQLKASKAIGVDLAPEAIEWCRKTNGGPGRDFQVGDAENLTFPDASFDAVVNVESAHNYPHVDKFMAEVFRVLRPGGHLLMADLRAIAEWDELRDHITAAGLVIDVEEEITPNVVRSLTLSSAERLSLVEDALPKVFRPAAKDFAGVQGSEVYNAFDKREMVYVRFVARKP